MNHKLCPICQQVFYRRTAGPARKEWPSEFATRITCGGPQCISDLHRRRIRNPPDPQQLELMRAEAAARVAAEQQARVEDIRDLLDGGESPVHAVARIAPIYGNRPVKPTSLARWLHRRGEHELARRFETVDVAGYRWNGHRQRVAA